MVEGAELAGRRPPAPEPVQDLERFAFEHHDLGISKSSVSRNFIEQSGRELKRLTERRFDDREFLVIYLDGVIFGEQHVLCAVGVDADGEKVVLGIKDGASENGATTTALLEDLVESGIDPGRRYLFVIDGSKALRSAIDRVFGRSNPVQRCRNHKSRNFAAKLPEDLADQVRSVMKAAFRLPWKEGIAKLRKQAEWLRPLRPDAAASLEEGLVELLTINRLELSSALRLCLGRRTSSTVPTPVFVSAHVGSVDGGMVLRWAASAFLETEKSFRKIQGYRDLWMLQAKLKDEVTGEKKSKVA